MTVAYGVIALTGLLVPAVALLAVVMCAGGFVFRCSRRLRQLSFMLADQAKM